MNLDLTAEEVRALHEALTAYLADFRRVVAGTENPEVRRDLNRRQALLEALAARLARAGEPRSA